MVDLKDEPNSLGIVVYDRQLIGTYDSFDAAAKDAVRIAAALMSKGASPVRSLCARTSPENIRHDAGRHSPCIAALGLALDGKLDRDLFAKPTRNCRREGTKEKAPPKEGRDQHLGTRGAACLLVA
jgi:hypothetical protein